MKRLLSGKAAWPVLALLVLVLACVAYLFRAPVALEIAKRVLASRLSADTMASLPDGLHIGICGAGSPFPDERRGGPCTVVIAGQRLLVFDAGNASTRNIGKLGLNTGRIEAIFLTHFHSDHMDGLGELLLQRWVAGQNKAPVPVYGPAGVEQVVAGLSQAYAQDRAYRVNHHGDATVPASGFGGVAMPFEMPGKRVVVLKDADLEIVAFAVDHAPVQPAVGYRISYKGRSVVLSGDTKKSAAVLQESANADVLVHEALSPQLVGLLIEASAQAGKNNLKKIFGDILDYHATPEQAAETARDAKVGYLLLNHIVPVLLPLPGMEKVFVGGAPSIYAGPLRVALDGDFLSLPAGSKDILHSQRF